MTIDIIAVKYPTAQDIKQNKDVPPVKHETEHENIKQRIQKLLFEDKYNYLLINVPSGIGMTEGVYLIDVIFEKNKSYNSRLCNHHPYSYLLKI
jgi:hypothetical protein